MSPLPVLLADESPCPGVADDGIALDMLGICTSCRRLRAFDDSVRSRQTVQRITPAAEWSDTSNAWRCANRLPAEAQ